MTTATKRDKPTWGGLVCSPCVQRAEQPQLATTRSAWSALPIMVFAGVCQTYKERHALVVGKRHVCCCSND
jgi:hypothetical protein